MEVFRRLCQVAVIAGAMWTYGAAAPVGQQPGPESVPADQQPVFRGRTDQVVIFAPALDRFGDMVLNLQEPDFIVEDDGRPQTLTVFERGLQPITAALLLDTSASMTLNLELARAAAEQFIIRMLPGDQARVGSFSDRITLSERFTGDRDALLRSFEDVMHIGNPTRLWDAIDQAMTAMEPLTGRRVIMVLTDGMDTLSTTHEGDVLARARAEEIMVYVVQFRSSARANMAEMPLSPSAGAIFSGDPRLRSPQPTDALRELARVTGGGHFLLDVVDDVNTTFTHVMQELHYQYVLGFTPQRLDGKLHDLRIRARRAGVTIRARQNYLAGRGADLP
jgi:VWFA-related protein